MKATMALTAIEGKDKSWTFILFQPPTKKLLKVKEFEGGIAEVVFLEQEKAQNFKSDLKMIAGCFYPHSNVEASFQHFFEKQYPLKEIHLELDGAMVSVSQKNRDVARLFKQFRQMKMQQKEKEKKEQSNEQLTTKILKFRNRKLTMLQKQERRNRRERWIKGIRK